MDKLFLTSQTYTLLCKTDVERAEWKEAIIPLLEQIQGKKKKAIDLISEPLSLLSINKGRLEQCLNLINASILTCFKAF